MEDGKSVYRKGGKYLYRAYGKCPYREGRKSPCHLHLRGKCVTGLNPTFAEDLLPLGIDVIRD